MTKDETIGGEPRPRHDTPYGVTGFAQGPVLGPETICKEMVFAVR